MPINSRRRGDAPNGQSAIVAQYRRRPRRLSRGNDHDGQMPALKEPRSPLASPSKIARHPHNLLNFTGLPVPIIFVPSKDSSRDVLAYILELGKRGTRKFGKSCSSVPCRDDSPGNGVNSFMSGDLAMSQRTRIIFWILFLFVGMQWIGDPIDVRLRGDWNLTADWNGLDDANYDNSHHYGLAELTDDWFVTPAMPMAGLAVLDWLSASSDPDIPQSPTTSPRIPRAPPAA